MPPDPSRSLCAHDSRYGWPDHHLVASTSPASILIGADYFWQFVGDHIVRGDGLAAMQSKIR